MKIYVLQCTDGKWYIGKTTRDLIDRVSEHFAGDGSEWTRLYKPIKLVKSKDMKDDLEEDALVKAYMKKYGIQHVRGGSYSAIQLPDYKILALEDELNGAADKCFRCGRKGHFVNSCFARTHVDGSQLEDDTSDGYVWECEICGKEFDYEDEAIKHETHCKNKPKLPQTDLEWFTQMIESSKSKIFVYDIEVPFVWNKPHQVANDVNNMTFRTGVAEYVRKNRTTQKGVRFEFIFDINKISMYKMIENEIKNIHGVQSVSCGLQVS